jgi:hypothetical protein
MVKDKFIVKKKTPYKDEKLYQWIMEKYDYFRKELKDSELLKEWTRFMDYENTDYWKDKRGRKGIGVRKAKYQSNKLFEVTETLKAAMTSSTPHPEVKPDLRYVAKEDIPAAEEWAKGLKRELVRIWEDTKMKSILGEMLKEYGIKGTSLCHAPQNPDTLEIEPDTEDIYSFLPDPAMRSPRDIKK